MYNGEACSECGVYLEPGERIIVESTGKLDRMPKNGEGFGVPVKCTGCA